MSNDLVNMGQFKDKVVEEVRLSFAKLIPEDSLRKFVDDETVKFQKEELPKIIQEELRKKFTKMVQEELEKPEYKVNYEHWHGRMGEAVTEITRALVPDIVQSQYEQQIQNIIERIRNAMQRGNLY